MKFDLFHSVSDPRHHGRHLGSKLVFEQFLEQTQLAESLGMDTVWVAESHFSSEVQKKTSCATIHNFQGEVGLNSDSFQLFHLIEKHTKKINLGTAIHNIVGGSGGPVSSADRVNTLNFINNHYWGRTLRIGVAAGRFPYQNAPFGVLPRDRMETELWFYIKRTPFFQALEIFLRLLRGEEVSSRDIRRYYVDDEVLSKLSPEKVKHLNLKYKFPLKVPSWWSFETLKLVPGVESNRNLRIVLGSSDPLALEVAQSYWDVDLFNLSFTPPEEIENLHQKMGEAAKKIDSKWHRSRLPRTVLVFIHPERKKAYEHANHVLDTYIEAMRGTAQVPDKKVLMERALIGDALEVKDQLTKSTSKGFHPEDRLMLWFEFNQQDHKAISDQMIYFSEQVAAKIS